MRLRCLAAACAVAVSACGQTAVSPAALTGAPSAAVTLEDACITATPGEFVVEPRNGNAYLSWAAVASAQAYEVEIHQVASGTVAVSHILADTRWEWDAQELGQGPYRARVRAIAGCGMGAWSVEDVFILNRSGQAPSTPPAAPSSVPEPPVSPPPVAPPPAPLSVCGTVRGHYVVNLLGKTFQRGVPPMHVPLALPAGTYRVHVETNDPRHRDGWQAGQTQEVVTVWGVGTTQDIPEAAKRQVTSFTAMLPRLAEIVVESGPDSVHGVCVAFVSQ